MKGPSSSDVMDCEDDVVTGIVGSDDDDDDEDTASILVPSEQRRMVEINEVYLDIIECRLMHAKRFVW